MFEREVLAAGGARPEAARPPRGHQLAERRVLSADVCDRAEANAPEGQNVLDHAGSLWVRSSSWPVEVTEG